MSKRFKTWNF